MHIYQLCIKHEVFITFAFQANKKREIMKPRVSTKLMGSSSTKIQGLLFNFFYSHGLYELLPVLPLHVALDKKPLPRLTHINAWEVFVIGYRRGLLALYGKFESFTWWQRFPVLNITSQGVKVGLSSQYKLRRAKEENKVLAYKQNLSNESEEGTKITVWKSCQIN